MATNEVICGDSLTIVPTLPRARMIFADPPDNTGMIYSDYKDKVTEEDYIDFLKYTFTAAVNNSDVFWLSYFYRYQPEVLRFAKVSGLAWHPFIWRFTFGQHRSDDCGNGYRPIVRISRPDIQWNTDEIRVESARQRMGDKRADPRGRVPDDVWEYSRVVGNCKERRSWISNQHPEGLIERMIVMSTKPGDLVVDMFAGSGTVHRVCKRLDRDSISIDISQDYCNRIVSGE
jgi:DNA modification methylase